MDMERTAVSHRFDGKVALVTGAAGGIGLAAAQALAREGAKDVLADLNAEGVAEAAADIERSGGVATSIGANVTDPAACAAMVAHAVKHYGGLHVAVNNAGIQPPTYGEFEDIRVEDWDRVVATDVSSVFYSIKAEAPAMRQAGGGAIVNTASAAGLIAVPNMASYVASKHGVAGLTRAAAIDLIRHGIRVNAVCPGLTVTPMLGDHPSDPAYRARWEAKIPIRRMASADEIASAILFLLSSEASYVVGTMLVVDGGMTAI
jgi:NAD(P)-dependent dehydrogenase (short-subunit alcohol dehydrogenase family)